MTDAATESLPFPKQRTSIQANLRKFRKAKPEVMKAWGGLHGAANEPGALDRKTKELIALAISIATQCDNCIAFHTHDTLKAGATEDEIMDMLGVAVLMGGGPSLMYATHVIEALEQFQEVEKTS